MRILTALERVAIWHDAATYWHVTRDPNFQLNPKFVPENLAEEDEGPYGSGLFVSPRRDVWGGSYGYGDRHHMVELEGPPLSKMPRSHVPYGRDLLPGEEPDEIFIPSRYFPKFKVKGITPYDYLKEPLDPKYNPTPK